MLRIATTLQPPTTYLPPHAHQHALYTQHSLVPRSCGKRKTAWYRLLVHARTIPLYFRKIVTFTLLVHVEEYTDRIFESSICSCYNKTMLTQTNKFGNSDTNGETNKTST